MTVPPHSGQNWLVEGPLGARRHLRRNDFDAPPDGHARSFLKASADPERLPVQRGTQVQLQAETVSGSPCAVHIPRRHSARRVLTSTSPSTADCSLARAMTP